MSSRTDEVLAVRSAAVEDWELGPDAARWRPDAGMAGQVADFARAAGMPVYPWQERVLEWFYDDTAQAAGIAPYGVRRGPLVRTWQLVPAAGY